MLKIEKVIGIGNQAKVFIGKYDGDVVAIKIIDKNIHTEWKEEIKILLLLKSEYIVNIIKCIVEENYVNHIMEYIPNDLYAVIQKGINEEEALIYVKKVAKGIEYLHGMNIMHRDIKPENILVDYEKNTKICDFGHACEFKEGEIFKDIKGTIFYFAPEIIKRKGYDYHVDIWMLGILYYEMIARYPPFYSESDFEVFNLILKNIVKFPDNFSTKTKDNILSILKKPNKRVSISDILSM
jgi:serine/threonine protein kinase